jgi:hypothetical protein
MTPDELAGRVLAQSQERLRRLYPTSPQWEWETVRVVPGPKYTKIDRGTDGGMSGMLMIENETGLIYGIKGYGKVHKGHPYGSLGTTDEWYWGDYYPERITEARRRGLLPGPVSPELFAATAPKWNCVDYPGEGMHYTPLPASCGWCGKTRAQIEPELDLLRHRAGGHAGPEPAGTGCRYCASASS